MIKEKLFFHKGSKILKDKEFSGILDDFLEEILISLIDSKKSLSKN